LVAKKEKCEAIEKEGKQLPATWKSIPRLEEEQKDSEGKWQRIGEDIVGLDASARGKW